MIEGWQRAEWRSDLLRSIALGIAYGIHLLLSLAGRLRWRGQDLALAAPEDSRYRRVLSMAGIDGSVILETTVDAARRRLLDAG